MLRSLETRVAFRVLLVVGITVGVGVVSLLCTASLLAISDRVQHSHEIIERLKDLRYFLKQAESGQRAYLLTGGIKDYLTPYNQAASVSKKKLAELAALVEDDPTQRSLLRDGLSPLLTKKFAEMDETLDQHRNGHPGSAVEMVRTGHGERLMREFDNLVDRADLYERRRLDDRSWDALLIRNLKIFLDGLGCLLIVAILIAVYIVVGREMRERKWVELELACARDMAEAASRAKGDFMANVSHEIRTPMNAILGMTELTLETELSAHQRENLQVVHSATDSLLAIINDLLDFSKMEAGKVSLAKEDFNLRDHIADTLGMLSLKAADKSLELSCRVAPSVPDRLSGDPSRLRQIVVNLVGNAIKFTEAGDVLVEVSVEARAEGEIQLHFRVTDTGIGIPPEKRELIFEPFTQADGSTTRLYGGTGLGLAISSQLVGLMGGRIWVESEIDRGSTFHFIVNFFTTDQDAPPAPVSLSSLRGLRVLVVDDNAVNRRILEEILTFWEMSPTLVASGEEAIVALETARDAGELYPLVLLDAMMPDMDGFSVARRIRSDKCLNTSVILMLTSSDRQGFADLARSAGIAACLNKPIHKNKLLDAILQSFHPSPSAEVAPGSPFKAPSKSRPLRILMAEDNPYNQRVAMLILAKSGHTVTLAANGVEAVHAASRDSYDLIIMDLQMPLMDGLQATAAIRASESGGLRRMPIIAMTAHAMREDRDRCLSAGMDGYVSKPIQAEAIDKAIQECLERCESTPLDGVEPAGSDGEPGPMDFEAALAKVDGDRVFFGQMAKLFVGESPRYLEEIREAIANRNGPAVVSPAHNLKNWIGNFEAEVAYAHVARLEALARTGSFEAASLTFSELECEIERLSEVLNRLDPEAIDGDGTCRVIEMEQRSRACTR